MRVSPKVNGRHCVIMLGVFVVLGCGAHMPPAATKNLHPKESKTAQSDVTNSTLEAMSQSTVSAAGFEAAAIISATESAHEVTALSSDIDAASTGQLPAAPSHEVRESASIQADPTQTDRSPSALTPVSKHCSYNTYEWHVGRRKAVGHRRVEKLRTELTDEESDPHDRRCTVCEQDQQTLKLSGLPPVTVCRYYADQVAQALRTIRDSREFKIQRLKGYRPGRTRGRVRHKLRTQFSNHSFGTAIDINPQSNGLYTRCRLKGVPKTQRDLKQCRLSLYGHWRPEERPRLTVVYGDIVHRSFTPFWAWGGTRKDAIKDFMHFSITGD